MKPKFKLHEIVKIKDTGEKVKIVGIDAQNHGIYKTTPSIKMINTWIFTESELAPYRPSRTGKYRDDHGRFMSEKELCRFCQSFVDEDGVLTNCTCGKCKAVLQKPEKKKIERISHNFSVKKSATIAQQRELLREHTNKINMLIDRLNSL